MRQYFENNVENDLWDCNKQEERDCISWNKSCVKLPTKFYTTSLGALAACEHSFSHVLRKFVLQMSNKFADQAALRCSLISTFVVHYPQRLIFLDALAKSKFFKILATHCS